MLLQQISTYTETIEKRDQLPIPWEHIFDGYTQVFREEIPEEESDSDFTSSEHSNKSLQTKIYLKEEQPSSSNNFKAKSLFYVAIFNYNKDFNYDSDSYDKTFGNIEDPLNISISQETLVKVELKGSTEKVSVDVKNNMCLHFLVFLSPDPDIELHFYPKFGLSHVILENDSGISQYLHNYQREKGDFRLDIDNYLLEENLENIYLRLLCPFYKKNEKDSVNISISVTKAMEPISSNI